MMKVLAFVLALIATPAHALDADIFSASLERAARSTLRNNVVLSIERAIEYLSTADPLGLGLRDIPQKRRHEIARAVYIAAATTGVQWRLLVAMAYVESALCTNMRGDKKPGKSGDRLYHWWSVGCLMVNMRWWGGYLSDIGLQQEDLLDYETGFVIGALILKHYQERYGFWNGVQRYNGIGKRARRYRERIASVYNDLQRRY